MNIKRLIKKIENKICFKNLKECKENELVFNIPISYKKKEEALKFLLFLDKNNYKIISNSISLILNDGMVKVIFINDKTKIASAGSTVTCMACWCSVSGGRKLLNTKEFKRYYKRIILENDMGFYEKLVKEKYIKARKKRIGR